MEWVKEKPTPKLDKDLKQGKAPYFKSNSILL